MWKMDRRKYTYYFRILNYLLLPLGLILDLLMFILKITGLFRPFRRSFCALVKKTNRVQYRILYNFRVYGTENVPKKGGAILACNHTSWLDPPMLWTAAPRDVYFMAKIEEFSMPVLKTILDLAGAFPVDRGHHDEQAIENAVKVLREGKLFVMFPEGTIPGEEDHSKDERKPDTGLLRGHTGVIRIALKAEVPIIPVAISGADKALPPEVFPRLEKPPKIGRGYVRMRFGKPFDMASCDPGQKEKDYTELRIITHELMLEIHRLSDSLKGETSD